MHRDPVTGQFTGKEHSYDDIEVVSFEAGYGIQAADLDGGTGFGAGSNEAFTDDEPLIDYDEIVDRNEELRLLSAEHVLDVFVNSTETADGTVASAVAITASPTRTGGIGQVSLSTDAVDPPVVGDNSSDDSIDHVGRQLVAVGTGPFSDGSTGVGGGGSAGTDEVETGPLPAEFGRFHPRDELFAVGQFSVWNIDDAGVHAQVSGQHVYGVLED